MILLISDIHGRSFWKDAVEKYADKVDRIVFIGDYLDPYPWEGITRKDAIRNFDKIIAFKNANKDKVILLLGNHDGPYIDKKRFYTRSRYDSSNAYHIEEMFRSHRSFFQLAHEEYLNGKRYLFTHSGLVYEWYHRNRNLIGELTVDNLNKLKDTPQGMSALCEVSARRGGSTKYGSIVWGDVRDMYEGLNKELPWDFQIFGHSQQEEHPIITKEFACLDCRKAFILTDDGGFQVV